MTSTAKTLANRRNGAKSRGPRTLAGKAKSSRNATRHGLRAELVVLPHVEDAEDYADHHQAVLADLGPVGAVELELAERVAVLMWRLRRVTRFEAAQLADAQRTAEHDAATEQRAGALFDRIKAVLTPANLDEGRWEVRHHEALVRLADKVADMPDDAPAPEGGDLVEAAARVAGVDLDETDALPDVDTYLEDVAWTGALVRTALDAIAAAAEDTTTVLELLDGVRRRAKLDVTEAKQRLADLEAAIAAKRGRGLMLPQDMPDRVVRYEAHLERSLFRTLHELDRRRAARAGGPPPLAVDLDVTVGRRVVEVS